MMTYACLFLPSLKMVSSQFLKSWVYSSFYAFASLVSYNCVFDPFICTKSQMKIASVLCRRGILRFLKTPRFLLTSARSNHQNLLIDYGRAYAKSKPTSWKEILQKHFHTDRETFYSNHTKHASMFKPTQFLRMKKSRLGKGRKRVICVNCDVYIDSTKTTSSSMARENILWKLGDDTTLVDTLLSFLCRMIYTHSMCFGVDSSFREKLMKARAIASVLFEVLSTVTSAAGSQVF